MPAHRSRGAGALRGLNGAAPPQTGSSPGCAAAGSPGSCDLHDAGPSRGCSAAGSCPLLHRRSWCSRCQPRSRCLQRCRSCWNDRSRTESATESSGGPWWGGAAGRWWMLAMRLEKVAVLLSSCLLSIGDGRMLPASSDAFKCFFFLSAQWGEIPGSSWFSPRASHKHHPHHIHPQSICHLWKHVIITGKPLQMMFSLNNRVFHGPITVFPALTSKSHVLHCFLTASPKTFKRYNLVQRGIAQQLLQQKAKAIRADPS